MSKYIEITNDDGYEWIEKGEMYRVAIEKEDGVYIKVFKTAFWVWNEDFKYITKEEYGRESIFG